MKKIICFLLSALLILSAAPFSVAFAQDEQENEILLGDVDADGKVTSADARLTLRAAVKLEQYAAGSRIFLAADINGNGVIEEEDARFIHRCSIKLEQTIYRSAAYHAAEYDKNEQDSRLVFSVGKYKNGKVPVTMCFADCVGMTSCHINFSYSDDEITAIDQYDGTDARSVREFYNKPMKALNSGINPAEYGCYFVENLWNSENWAEFDEIETPINGEVFESDIFTFTGNENAVVTATATICINETPVRVEQTFTLGEQDHDDDPYDEPVNPPVEPVTDDDTPVPELKPGVNFIVGDYANGKAVVSMHYVDLIGLESGSIKFGYEDGAVSNIKTRRGSSIAEMMENDPDNLYQSEFNSTSTPAHYGFYYQLDNTFNDFEAATFTFTAEKGTVINVTEELRVNGEKTEVSDSFVIGEEKAPAVLPGDVDGDGLVSAADSRLTLRAAVGLEKYAPDSAEYLAANVFAEDGISAADANWIFRKAIMLEEGVPEKKETHSEKAAELRYSFDGNEKPVLSIYAKNVQNLSYLDLKILCPASVADVKDIRIPKTTTEFFHGEEKNGYCSAVGNFFPAENGDPAYILFSAFFSDNVSITDEIKLAEIQLTAADPDCEFTCRVMDCNILDWQGNEQTVKHVHIPGEPTITNEVAATCSAEGHYHETVICTECGAVITDEEITIPVDNNAHVYGEWTTGDADNHTKICANNPEHVIAEAHKWDKGFVRNQSTFTEYGEKVYTCSVCGAEKTEQLDKLPPLVSTDNTTNISVTYIDVSYSEEINVVTKNIDKPEEKVSMLKKTYARTVAVDISTQIKGKEVQPKTPVSVQIPMPKGFNADTTEVYHLDAEDNATKMTITIADGFISFDTTGFSRFVVVDTASEVKFELGKVDTDAQISAADARLTLRASVGLETYKPFSREFSAADIDNDGKITSGDARVILRASVGLEKLES